MDPVDGQPAADGGNAEIVIPAPSNEPAAQDPKPDTTGNEPKVDADPAKTAEPVKDGGTPSEQVPELFELPDGRKVDAKTVAKEYQSILSDYTRKSQKLAELERNPNINKTVPEAPTAKQPWETEGWVPKNYTEILDAAKASVYADMEAKQNAAKQNEARVEALVDSEIAQIKTYNPKLNEEELFKYASKYNFTSLISAYNALQEVKETEKATEQRVLKNIQARGADPIGGTPAAGSGGAGDGTDFAEVQGSSMYDLVRSHMNRIKGNK